MVEAPHFLWFTWKEDAAERGHNLLTPLAQLSQRAQYKTKTSKKKKRSREVENQMWCCPAARAHTLTWSRPAAFALSMSFCLLCLHTHTWTYELTLPKHVITQTSWVFTEERCVWGIHCFVYTS